MAVERALAGPKRKAAAVLTALLLACGFVAFDSSVKAEAATATVNGQVYESMYQWSVWRTKTTSSSISWAGTIGPLRWSGNWGWNSNARWALGMRSGTHVQFARVELQGHPNTSGTSWRSGTFTGTAPVSLPVTFAMNSVISKGPIPAPGVVADFKGTLTY